MRVVRRCVVLAILTGCGPGSAAVPVTDPATEPGPRPDTDGGATGPDARLPEPDARPPAPVAVIENVLVAGTPAIADVTAALEARAADLAACLSADGVARTTELSLILGEGPARSLRVAWQDGAPITNPCVADVLAVGTYDRNTYLGTAYAVVRSGPPGVEPPPAPSPPDRKTEMTLMFCDLFVVSGAEREPVETRAQVAQDYARTHVRHPHPLHIASSVWLWAPQDREFKLVKAVKAEGIKRCALQRF